MAGVPPHLLLNGEAIIPNLRELSRHCERQIRARSGGAGDGSGNGSGNGDSATIANSNGPAVNESADSLDFSLPLLPDLPLPKLFVPAAPVPTPGTIGSTGPTSPASPRRSKLAGAGGGSLDEWEIVDG